MYEILFVEDMYLIMVCYLSCYHGRGSICSSNIMSTDHQHIRYCPSRSKDAQ